METYSSDLLLLADEQRITVILVIIIISLGLTLFLYLFGWTGDLSHRTVDFGPQQRNMKKVSNPFALELDQRTKGLGAVLTLNLSTLCPCHLVVVWGPKIQTLHDLILAPGRTIRKKMLTDLKQNSDLQPIHSDVLQLAVEGKHTISLPTPECVSSQALGDMPRSRYPLAVFVFTPGRGRDEADGVYDSDNATSHHGDELEQDNDIIGLFAIIHLKDDIVTKDSHVIARYVKTAGVPIYSLKALFVPSTDHPHQTSSSNHSSPSHSQQNVNQPFSTTLRHRNATNFSGVDNDNIDSMQPASDELTDSQRNEPVYAQSSASCDKIVNNCCTEINQEQASANRDTPFTNHNNVDPTIQMEYLRISGNHANVLGESDIPNRHGAYNSSDVLTGDTADSKSDSIVNDCVVCQTKPAKCAILPCRHNCVCIRCLRLLDKCPICRGTIESYFIVGSQQDGESSDDEGVDDEEVENEGLLRQGIAAHVENVFERVNQMVGFA